MSSVENNPVLAAIKERTSTRSFKREQIKDSELDILLDAAIASPSASNAQPWRYIVVQNQELLTRMNQDIHAAIAIYGDAYAKNFAKEGFNFFYNAPTVIFVAGDASNRWSDNDCGIASQSIMLAGHSIGIGSCVIGFARRMFETKMGETYSKELNVPEGYKLLFGISIGYIAKPTPVRSRKRDVVQVIR